MKPLGSKVFPAAPEQARAARRWIAAQLRSGHPARDDCVLLVSETFTNAVRHSHGDHVEIRAHGNEHTVAIEVIDDGGPTLPHHINDPDGEGGRGLPILRALAGDWGYQPLEHGRLRVWFTTGNHQDGLHGSGT